MLTTTIESLNGKLCTIIRKPFDAEWVREQLAMGIPVVVRTFSRQIILCYSKGNFFDGLDGEERDYVQDNGLYDIETITILPALKRNPTTEEVALYESAGLRVFSTEKRGIYRTIFFPTRKSPVTHAVDAQRNRHEIALEG